MFLFQVLERTELFYLVIKNNLMLTRNVYTLINEALPEIERRRADVELRKKVNLFLGEEALKVLGSEPRTILTRQLASPDMEFDNFINLSKSIGLKPFCWEFLDDFFVTSNEDKAALGRITFYDGYDKNNRIIINRRKIIDLTGREEGNRISEILTTWSEKLVDFHHRALKKLHGDVEYVDMSYWYRSKGLTPKEYYPYLLALFICDGILFENFIEDGPEKIFSTEVFEPAYNLIVEKFGVKPIIVEAIPENEMDNIYWWCYSKEVEKLIPNCET
jgi:hypothetical protein